MTEAEDGGDSMQTLTSVDDLMPSEEDGPPA